MVADDQRTKQTMSSGIYEGAVEAYNRGGPTAVEEYADALGIKARAWCEPCEQTTPSHDNACLVCGSQRERHTYIVAAYEVCQAYGGPEEGGWWYYQGDLIRPLRLFRNKSEAYRYASRFNDKAHSRRWGPNADRRPLDSVLSDGEVEACVYTDIAPQHFPKERPMYD
jgi:hypothetical protein